METLGNDKHVEINSNKTLKEILKPEETSKHIIEINRRKLEGGSNKERKKASEKLKKIAIYHRTFLNVLGETSKEKNGIIAAVMEVLENNKYVRMNGARALKQMLEPEEAVNHIIKIRKLAKKEDTSPSGILDNIDILIKKGEVNPEYVIQKLAEILQDPTEERNYIWALDQLEYIIAIPRRKLEHHSGYRKISKEVVDKIANATSSAYQLVINLLQNQSLKVQKKVLFTIREFSDYKNDFCPFLIAEFNKSDELERLILETMAKMNCQPRNIDFLLSVIRDKDEGIEKRWHGARILVNTDQTSALETLPIFKEMIRKSVKNQYVRNKARVSCIYLGKIPSKDVIPILLMPVRKYKKYSEKVINGALQAFENIGESISTILSGSNAAKKNSLTKKQALELWTEMAKKVIPAIIKLIKKYEIERDIVPSATKALASINEKDKTFPFLLELSRKKFHHTYSKHAKLALDKMFGKTIPQKEESLKAEKNKEVRKWLALKIGKAGGNEAIEVLEKLIGQEEDKGVCKALIEALGEIEYPVEESALVLHTLKEKGQKRFIRKTAKKALENLVDRSHYKTSEELISNILLKRKQMKERAASRDENLRTILRRYTKITAERISQLLGFESVYDLDDWLLDLPADLAFRVEGDHIIIPQQVQSGGAEASEAIERLLESFRDFEQSKKGKKS